MATKLVCDACDVEIPAHVNKQLLALQLTIDDSIVDAKMDLCLPCARKAMAALGSVFPGFAKLADAKTIADMDEAFKRAELKGIRFH